MGRSRSHKERTWTTIGAEFGSAGAFGSGWTNSQWRDTEVSRPALIVTKTPSAAGAAHPETIKQKERVLWNASQAGPRDHVFARSAAHLDLLRGWSNRSSGQRVELAPRKVPDAEASTNDSCSRVVWPERLARALTHFSCNLLFALRTAFG